MNKTISAIAGAFLLVTTAAHAAPAKNTWRPLKTTCAVKSSKQSKPYSVLEFVVSEPSGVSSHTTVLAATYPVADFPPKNFRVVGTPVSSFRIAVSSFEEAYARGEYGAHLAIYEEKNSQLIRRAFSGVSLGSLRHPFRLAYVPTDSEYSVVCFTYAFDESSKKRPASKKTSTKG